MDVSIVVINIHSPDHFSSLEVGNAQSNFADGVAAYKFHDLSGSGEFGINLQAVNSPQLKAVDKHASDNTLLLLLNSCEY